MDDEAALAAQDIDAFKLSISLIAADMSLSSPDLIGAAADPTIRAIQAGWSAPRELAGGAGSNREPALSVDETNRMWLIWSQQSRT